MQKWLKCKIWWKTTPISCTIACAPAADYSSKNAAKQHRAVYRKNGEKAEGITRRFSKPKLKGMQRKMSFRICKVLKSERLRVLRIRWLSIIAKWHKCSNSHESRYSKFSRLFLHCDLKFKNELALSIYIKELSD